ncbi:hypothetical protein KR018_006739 [Drosophila ironensis]|nr:hypothetical protein KR018_006739 [Drosophila ironensis]
MIRAAFVGRPQFRMIRAFATIRDCTLLHSKAPAVAASHIRYIASGGEDKPEKKVTANYTAGEFKSSAAQPLDAADLEALEREVFSERDITERARKPPKINPDIMLGVDKKYAAQPGDDFEKRANEYRGDDKFRGGNKTDAQKRAEEKAKEARDAAAKQLSDMVANLPSRQQAEKYFFRVVAFLYDLTYLTCTWAVNFIEQNIVRNATVQHYWKRFHEKMEQAKKD